MRFVSAVALFLILAALTIAACGGDDDDTPSQSASTSPTPTLNGSPTASPDPLIPPLEGPERVPYLGDKQDFRENPDYELPDPNVLPTPADASDPIYDLPQLAECPDGWQTLYRGPELFQLCYPDDWTVGADAYVNSPNETRWYAGGVFKFPGEPPDHQLAHVSVYAIPQFTRPFPYIKECPTPYSVTLDGQPAVMCPSFPASHPEARLVSYHVFRENFDYFFQIVLYYKWDESTNSFSTDTDQDAFDTAIKIIRSIEFLAPETNATASPTASP